MSAKNAQDFLVGIFDDDDAILKASFKVREAGFKIHEVYSPFPIHGIDDALGYKRSRLPRVAFMAGATGTTCAASFMTWTLGFDWPMIIGGKPFVGPPSLIPISFEMTVLFAALGMVTTFLLASGLGPGSNKMVLDPRASDDKFVMALDLDKNSGKDIESLKAMLKSYGASEVTTKTYTHN